MKAKYIMVKIISLLALILGISITAASFFGLGEYYGEKYTITNIITDITDVFFIDKAGSVYVVLIKMIVAIILLVAIIFMIKNLINLIKYFSLMLSKKRESVEYAFKIASVLGKCLFGAVLMILIPELIYDYIPETSIIVLLAISLFVAVALNMLSGAIIAANVDVKNNSEVKDVNTELVENEENDKKNKTEEILSSIRYYAMKIAKRVLVVAGMIFLGVLLYKPLTMQLADDFLYLKSAISDAGVREGIYILYLYGANSVLLLIAFIIFIRLLYKFLSINEYSEFEIQHDGKIIGIFSIIVFLANCIVRTFLSPTGGKVRFSLNVVLDWLRFGKDFYIPVILVAFSIVVALSFKPEKTKKVLLNGDAVEKS